jgi:FkbM family methyltransferase
MLIDTLLLRDPENRCTVHALDCAASAARGGLYLPAVDYTRPADFGSVRLTKEPYVEGEVIGEYGGRRGVMGFPLDEIVDFYEFARVDLLKIDVEGMEMDVLLGAEQTIKKHRPILYVEYIHGDLPALVSWIKAMGYEHVRQVGNNLLADPSDVLIAVRPIVHWPDAVAITEAWPLWRHEEQAEWNRLAGVIDRLTVIEELLGPDLRAVERVQTRIGRSLSDRCPHGILLWLECGHCNTHVDGDLPTLLSPAALATLERLAESAPPGGCFVEVGVFRGGSLQRLYRIAERQGRQIFGVDTFVGLVERSAVDQIPVGHFDAGGEPAAQAIQDALPNAHIVMGPFPAIAMASPDVFSGLRDIAFAHVDCDQYVSIKNTLAWLWFRMTSDGIILCDDFDALNGAQLAVREFAFAATGSLDSIERTPEGKAVLRKP